MRRAASGRGCYQIAEGYSLYRDKFKFEVQPAEVALGAAQLPPGKIKQDESFGRVEIYRHAVAIKLPLTRNSTGAQVITLKSTAQGCADAGVCYPPLTQSAKLNLPAAVAASVAPQSGLPLLQKLGIGLGGADDFLPPEQAFKLSVSVKDSQTLHADFKPAKYPLALT